MDWSQPDLNSFPEFVHLHANEIITRPGDALYIPTDWFHYIISLNVNFQCNTRSGRTTDYVKDLQVCDQKG